MGYTEALLVIVGGLLVSLALWRPSAALPSAVMAKGLERRGKKG